MEVYIETLPAERNPENEKLYAVVVTFLKGSTDTGMEYVDLTGILKAESEFHAKHLMKQELLRLRPYLSEWKISMEFAILIPKTI